MDFIKEDKINVKIRKWAEDYSELKQAKLTEDINYIEHNLDDITYTFRYYADKVAPPNKEQMTMFWYVFISQLFKNSFRISMGGDLISTRFSATLMQSSRTGKNYSSDIIFDISKHTNVLRQEKISSFTDNAIIGQIIHQNVDYNDKKGITYPDNEDARKPFREGLMETTDILIIEEGKTLFQGQFKESVITNIQEIIDEKGVVNIARGTGFFKRKTDCSLMITSVPFDKSKVSEIIDNGFFQRFLLMYKIFSNEEVKAFDKMKEKKRIINTPDFEDKKDSLIEKGIINENDEKQFKLSNEENENYKKLFASVLNKKQSDVLKKFSKKSKSKEHIISFSSDATCYMNEELSKIFSINENKLFGDVVEKISSFKTVAELVTAKISAINCFLNGRNIIQVEDVRVGLNFAKIHFDSVIILLSSLHSSSNKENILLSSVIGNKWIKEDLVVRKILSYKKQDQNNSKLKLDELVRKNYLETYEDERTGEMKYKCRDVVYELAYNDEDYKEILKQKSKAIKMFNDDPIIRITILFIKYLEDIGIDFSNKIAEAICKIFLLGKEEYHYKFIEKLRRNEILPKNKKKWKLQDEILEYVMNKQYTPLEEEVFQYIINFQEFLNVLNEIKLKPSNKKEMQKRIKDAHLKYNIGKIPNIVKEHLGEENLNHLKIPYHFPKIDGKFPKLF